MKTVGELFADIKIEKCSVDLSKIVNGIEINSKNINCGDIFFALKDNTYVEDAIKNGAVCVVTESLLEKVPCIVVSNIRQIICTVCARFYDNPHLKMNFIGVVGTNGKTTTTHIIEHILSYSNKKICLIGTLGAKICGKSYPMDLTTPDPNTLYKILSIAKENDVEFVVMEISAHAIYWQKLYGIMINLCVFTNLSQDHLDFFKDMNSYIKTKKDFFTPDNILLGIVNIDDKVGKEIIDNKQVCTVSYGLHYPSDVFAMDIDYSDKTTFIANVFDDIMLIESPLLGEFNISNTLAAITATKILGIDTISIYNSLKSLSQIEGRFNVITMGKTAIIDYAHTPDGLKNVLITARKMTSGKIIVVFGCGGDRDRKKRPIMGRIAAKYSDIAVITSDNPRFEDANKIIDEIAVGFEGISRSFIKISDRKKAIEFALAIAKKEDIVLIAGKGGEDYIDIMGKKQPYSDKVVCSQIMGRFDID